jgi:hypothetical protein
MTATPDHGSLDQDVQGIHVPFQYKFADEASRTGAPASRLTGGASKFAYQEDTSAIWLLADGGSEAVTEGANLGPGGYGIFSEKSGASLLFKTLIAGTAITLASAASTVTIANDIDGVNLGTGIEAFRETTGGSLSFRTLVGAGTVSIASAASTVTITGTGGGSEAVTEGANIGTGFEVFREKSSASLMFRTLIGGDNVTIASATSAITINSIASTGEIFLAAAGGWPSTTNGCSDATKKEYAANGIDLYSLDFDQAASQYAQWSVWMPDNWNAGTITYKTAWSASAGSGDTMWGLQGRSYANDDGIDQAWGTAQTVIDTLTSVNDMCISPESNAITLAGTPAAGEFTQFRVYRNSGSNGDTLSLAARLFGVKVYYTKE